MKWLDAKCHDCGLQREVILFIEPTKPRDLLRCPRCASQNVEEVKDVKVAIPEVGVDVLQTLGLDHYSSVVDLVRDHREQAQFFASLIGADRKEDAAPINWLLVKSKFQKQEGELNRLKLYNEELFEKLGKATKAKRWLEEQLLALHKSARGVVE